MPELGLREKKKAEVKQALFRAAMELFGRKGIERTSVDEIAERAGFSRATYFNYFGTKEGVLRYYGEQLQERVERLLLEADAATSPIERIREMLLAMAREADFHGEDLKLVYLYSLRDPDYLARPTPARLRVFRMVCDLVAEAQQGGEMRRDLPAADIALHILSVYHSAVMAVITGIGAAEPTLRSAWLFILDGVRGGDTLAR